MSRLTRLQSRVSLRSSSPAGLPLSCRRQQGLWLCFRYFNVNSKSQRIASITTPRDPNTLSNYHNFTTTHTVANFTIDFDHKRLDGNVILQLRSVTNAEARDILLDTSYLDIKEVKLDGSSPKWELLPRLEPYGSALKISLEAGVEMERSVEIDVGRRHLRTVAAASVDKHGIDSSSNHQRVYSFAVAHSSADVKQEASIYVSAVLCQCQAIHARSVFPCQDTPDVKSTFDFNIHSPLPVFASGLSTAIEAPQPDKDGQSETRLYSFKQDVPIPSYLFAIASGDIATASIGPRSVVATGPEEIEAAKWELEADTERFIQVAEKIVYPYAWTTYNVLVLPPSFPFGGMENPVFTFATPTIISGDRENVDVVAHELAHSWSGNLILAEIHGEPYRSFSAIIGWKALSDSITHFGSDHEFTKLIIALKGKDPDDAFSSIPYEKGSTFLYYLENLIGKERWDKFIPYYFTTYKYKSLDSYDFKSTLLTFFASDTRAFKLINDLDWDTWFYAPGFPPKPKFDTSLVDVCYALADKWESLNAETLEGGKDRFSPKQEDITGWTANQVVVFLERVLDFKRTLPKHVVKVMGKIYGLDKSKNVEVVSRYFRVGLKSGDEDVYQPTAELLATTGRMKFVRSISSV
ncbi:MAG: hypothetical protein Q9187_000842 [Circinaria calcarea]